MSTRLKKPPLLSLTIAVLVIASSCGITSRYRLDLFVSSGDSQKKVKVEYSELFENAAIADPYRDTKLAVAEGNVAMVTVGTRWSSQNNEKFSLLGFDDYWRCRIYLQLPPEMSAGRIALADNSFLHLLGHYHLKAEQKIFLPTEGHFTLDSVTDKALFFSLDGAYQNRDNQPMKFTGQFKVNNSQ